MRAAVVLGVAAVAAGVLLAARQVANVQAQADADQGDGSTALDYINPIGAIERQIDGFQVENDMSESNVAAFLDLIAYSEGTAGRSDGYRICYGYRHTIRDLSEHPAVTGEWRGEKLSDAMCKGAGLNPGCVSTAAGRYQLIRPTWAACKRALGLPDFSPASQDAAAVYLIRQRGAINDVRAGRVAEAVDKCRREWASLPGAGYGQGERKLSTLIAAFQDAGGVLA